MVLTHLMTTTSGDGDGLGVAAAPCAAATAAPAAATTPSAKRILSNEWMGQDAMNMPRCTRDAMENREEKVPRREIQAGSRKIRF
jgi:hypothetical protein